MKPSPADLAKSRPPEKPSEDDLPDQGTSDQSTSDQGEPQVEQTVLDRPTESVPEHQHVPSESPDQLPDQVPDQVPDQTLDETPDETPVETPDEVPPAPAARVVTSTRRRTARRPAGPPSQLVAAPPTSGVGEQAQADEPVETATQEVPTWPEADVAEDPESENGEGENGEHGDEESGTGFSLTHVPVKRKGSRKR